MSAPDAIDLWLRDTYAYLSSEPLSYLTGLKIKRDRRPAEVADLGQFLPTTDMYVALADYPEYRTADYTVSIVITGLRDVYFNYRQYLPPSQANLISNVINYYEQPSFHEADYYPHSREEHDLQDYFAYDDRCYLIPEHGVNGETVSLGMEYDQIERTLVNEWLNAARLRMLRADYQFEEPLLDIDPVFPVVAGSYLYGSITPFDVVTLTVPDFLEIINSDPVLRCELPGLPVQVQLHFDKSDFYDPVTQTVVGPILN